jgi:hypothetical protein
MPHPVPRPWLYRDYDVPAWCAAHLAELERPLSIEEGIGSKTNDIKAPVEAE